MINIEQNLSKVLEKDDTKILLIINREELDTSNGILESKNIVAGIIFGVHNQFGTVIDYLAVHALKWYNSFGPILLNLSQVYSSIIIKKKSLISSKKMLYLLLGMPRKNLPFLGIYWFSENNFFRSIYKKWKITRVWR